jgi:hypothetical protein
VTSLRVYPQPKDAAKNISGHFAFDKVSLVYWSRSVESLLLTSSLEANRDRKLDNSRDLENHDCGLRRVMPKLMDIESVQ